MDTDPDRRFVASLCASRPRRLLVVSDFHLGSGREPDTGTWLATENFYADEAFAAWVAHYIASEPEPRTVLVLNGDTFDFVRVSEVPEEGDYVEWEERLRALGEGKSSALLKADRRRSERWYGLRTDDFKSVWKLSRIIASHETFFAALASWLVYRPALMIVGNHDVELHWPLVRKAIRQEVENRGGDPALLLFHDGRVRFGNVCIEHGHQYDPMTRVDGPPRLKRDESQLNLPLATFLSRYLINKVEALDPFIDNVKPVQAALLRVVRQRPLKAFARYFGGWRFVGRAVVKWRLNVSVLVIALMLLAPLLLIPLVLLPPQFHADLLARLQLGPEASKFVALAVTLVATGALPYLIGALNDLRRHFPRRRRDQKAAHRIAHEELGGCPRSRCYVCMGHTHDVGAERIADAGDGQYVNTGTWTALWPNDRPDLLGRTVLTYARFDATDRDNYAGGLLEWDVHAGRPRPATVLVRERRRSRRSY